MTETTGPTSPLGDPAAPHAAAAPVSLRRCPHHRMVAGVAAGIADRLGVDPIVVRVAFVVLALVGGLAVPLYLAMWLLVPEEGADQSLLEELVAHGGRRLRV